MRILGFLKCIAKTIVLGLHIPPSLLRYSCLRSHSPCEYARLTGGRFEELESAGVSYNQLPKNIENRDDLFTESRTWGISFRDVPDRKTKATFIATIPDCRIISYCDEGDNEFFAIVTRLDTELQVRGTCFDHNHRRMLYKTSETAHIAKAAWVLEMWSPNYFHWLIYHLPKIVLLQEYGFGDCIILTERSRQYSVIDGSLELLGLQSDNLPRLRPSILHVDELTVVGMDYFPVSCLLQVRDKLAGKKYGKARRKLFISREKATWRHLENERAIWSAVRDFGYEKVIMEALSFKEQVNLMSDAVSILSLHGAGLANMLFAPSGAHVMEIVNPEYPLPVYYALACALGHHYWLLRGQAIGGKNPVAQDVRCDLDSLLSVINKVEAMLATSG
jgi:capsular polysaccharide biosynthesis protein